MIMKESERALLLNEKPKNVFVKYEEKVEVDDERPVENRRTGNFCSMQSSRVRVEDLLGTDESENVDT